MTSIAATDTDMQFRLVTGMEALRQRIAQHLRFARGEYFIDTSQGVPYLDDVIARPANLPLAQQVVTAAIQSVEGVLSVTDVSVTLDKRKRVLNYQATVKATEGLLSVAGAV